MDFHKQLLLHKYGRDLAGLGQPGIDQTILSFKDQIEGSEGLKIINSKNIILKDFTIEDSKGDLIKGLDSNFPDHVKIFHAGTSSIDDKTVTAGGRVLCITALGETVGEAKNYTYDAIKNISYEGMFFRNDIGYRAIKREN